MPGQRQQADGARGVRDGEVVAADVPARALGGVRVVARDAGDGVT